MQNDEIKNVSPHGSNTVLGAVSRTLGDYDIWYKPCSKCGYDTGKSTIPKDGNKRCWKCGDFVQRDYSDRALKSK